MNRTMTAKEVLDAHWDGKLPVKLIPIAEAMGIRVFKRQGMSESGIVDYDELGPRIIFNPDEPNVRQRFTVAHEIGHVALGHVKQGGKMYRDDVRMFFSTEKSPEETEANQFAARLLMPADHVKTTFYKMPDLSIRDMADIFKVSEAAMRYRLMNLGLIRG